MRSPFNLFRLFGWSTSLIVSAICLSCGQRCEAQTAHAENIDAADEKGSAALAIGEPSLSRISLQTPAGNEKDNTIIVTGRRWGQADIASERDLDEDRIAAYGANTIGDLLEDIAPLIGGTRDTPVVLVNGRRINSATEVTGYPPEALKHVAILPPEAAARYGYAAGKRVVNLELKKNFASTDVDAGFSMPFTGGSSNSQLSVGRSVIDGNTRWNVQLRGSYDTPLLKSERDIPVRSDVEAILPSLEAAEGRSIDPNRYESLTAKARSVNMNIGVTRPVDDFFLSLSANAGFDRSTQLIGMPLSSLILPSAGAGETFYRLVGGRALESQQRSTNMGASASLSGLIAGWQASISASYSNNRNNSSNDTGYDSSALQQRVDAGDSSFDPSGPWPYIPLRTANSRSNSKNFSATFNASKSILKLPAGEASTSVTVNASHSRSRFSTLVASNGNMSQDRFSSNQLDGRWSLTLPVANRSLDVLAPLGDLGLDLSMEFGKASRSRTRYKWDAGVRWAPFSIVDFRASFGRENVEPLFEQLHGPRIEVVTRLFDFAQQEYVQPIRVFGGNPGLEGGSVNNLSMNVVIRPIKGDFATFNINYRRRIAKGGIISFPTLTPDVEAIFPERVMRDTSGRLISINARPINISHDRTESITSGVNLLYTAKGKAHMDVPIIPDNQRPWTFSLSIIHSWQLASEMVIRRGLPVLDRLRDSGLPRHNVIFNLVAGRRGMGVSLNGNWNGAARVRSNDEMGSATEFLYPSFMKFNLGLFAEPEHWGGLSVKRDWASNLRISLDIQNILGGFRKVSVKGDITRRELTHDEIDPLGRTIRLSIRKQF